MLVKNETALLSISFGQYFLYLGSGLCVKNQKTKLIFWACLSTSANETSTHSCGKVSCDCRSTFSTPPNLTTSKGTPVDFLPLPSPFFSFRIYFVNGAKRVFVQFTSVIKSSCYFFTNKEVEKRWSKLSGSLGVERRESLAW